MSEFTKYLYMYYVYAAIESIINVYVGIQTIVVININSLICIAFVLFKVSCSGNFNSDASPWA